MTRKPINKDIEAGILVESRRRCCICFGLNRDLKVKSGQIAHLDKDNTNSSYDNLAFLYFDHHDQYDSKTSQSKNFTIKEVKRYREELKDNFLTIEKSSATSSSQEKKSTIDFKKEEIRKVLIEILSESGTITKFMPIAHKTGLSKTTIENNLIELAQEQIIRIDRPKGNLNRTFSLAESNENLIIDAFIKTLGDSVIEEQRYVRINHYEIDAIIHTSETIFVVEVKNAKYLNPERVKSTIDKLNKCRKGINISDNAKNVLLIGMNDSTEKLNDSLKEIESQGVIVKFIEINK
jgi:Holliday junction resolvase-like predicted endonuclease